MSHRAEYRCRAWSMWHQQTPLETLSGMWSLCPCSLPSARSAVQACVALTVADALSPPFGVASAFCGLRLGTQLTSSQLGLRARCRLHTMLACPK